jgi:hypothetical protein
VNKINTFVIHYTKLIERKNHIINILKDEFLNVKFIADFDKEEITKFNIKQFYFPDKNKSIFSRFLYAIILTFVLILISIYLNRPIPQTSLATPKK